MTGQETNASQSSRPQTRIIQIIFPAACTSEKYFSAASVSEGRAQSAAIPIGNEIVRFHASSHTPVKSNGGVYSARAAVRSWVKPSRMPQFSMYATAERYSERVTWRASEPSALSWGVYWLMRENSTSPGRNVSATQSMQRRVLSMCPGSTRWRITTPRFSRPFSSTQGPVWRTISRMANLATGK